MRHVWSLLPNLWAALMPAEIMRQKLVVSHPESRKGTNEELSNGGCMTRLYESAQSALS